MIQEVGGKRRRERKEGSKFAPESNQQQVGGGRGGGDRTRPVFILGIFSLQNAGGEKVKKGSWRGGKGRVKYFLGRKGTGRFQSRERNYMIRVNYMMERKKRSRSLPQKKKERGKDVRLD